LDSSLNPSVPLNPPNHLQLKIQLIQHHYYLSCYLQILIKQDERNLGQYH
jgi:hypothetical protein